MAVRGRAEPGGDFVVSDVTFAGLAPQAPLPARPPAGPDRYVALVSGLSLAQPAADGLSIQLLVDWLTGHLGAGPDQATAAGVVRLVLAGGAVGTLEALAGSTTYTRQQTRAVEPLRDADATLTELAAALPVDLMPGAADPSNTALPQQPLHACLLRGASAYESLCRVTNPHAFEVDGVRFLGTSGQNVDDVARYSRGGDRLAMAANTLRWRHVAPTAPDTLACFPYHESDPFIIETCPHVYFAGCQPEFAAGTVGGGPGGGPAVRIVLVPSFADTGVAVLVNLRTLACRPISFASKLG